MRVILDTSAIIYLNRFDIFQEKLTVPGVINEVKDRISRLKLSSMELRVEEPSTESIEKVRKVAESLGDIDKLSQTDIKVLALALEKGYTIVSDDRNIQNVAKKLGIEFISIFSPRIKKLIVWKKFCKHCKKIFGIKETVCPICGSRLIRIRWKENA